MHNYEDTKTAIFKNHGFKALRMESNTSAKKDTDDGTIFLTAGGGLTAVAVAGFAATSAVCPACVVGAPLLIGYGLYKRSRCKKME